jgi:hypothetical protein
MKRIMLLIAALLCINEHAAGPSGNTSLEK